MKAITTNLTHVQFRTLYNLARQCGYITFGNMWDVFEYMHTKTLFIDDSYQLQSSNLDHSSVLNDTLSYEDFIRYMTEIDSGLSLSDISDTHLHGTIPLGTLVYVNTDNYMRGQVLEVTGNIQDTNTDYPNELSNGRGGGWDIASLRLPTPTEIRVYYNVSLKKVRNHFIDGRCVNPLINKADNKVALNTNKDEVQNKSKEISTRSGAVSIRPRRSSIKTANSSGLVGNEISPLKRGSQIRKAKISPSVLIGRRS